MPFTSAQRMNLIAGGNATGKRHVVFPTLRGSHELFDPFRVAVCWYGILIRGRCPRLLNATASRSIRPLLTRGLLPRFFAIAVCLLPTAYRSFRPHVREKDHI